MSKLTSPIQITPHDIFTESSRLETDLGQIAYTTDGRKFRYALAGASALVAGTLQQGPAIIDNHQNVSVAAAVTAGATAITVTLGATLATANQYAGGYIVVNDVTGEGQTFLIKSHPAAALSASLTLSLDPPDNVKTALDTTSQCCLYPNKFRSVIQMPTTITGPVVGVPLFAVTAAYYFWLQTGGPVACLNGDLALTVGSAVSPSNATAGAVENGVIAQGFVGRALQTGVDTEYRMIDLQLD